jgi:hypothetical protein
MKLLLSLVLAADIVQFFISCIIFVLSRLLAYCPEFSVFGGRQIASVKDSRI